ncbi:perineurial glial growth [Tyrophagus putrescentiae]|nr:perineurial glial growth [Tyrophagus putrescentiae]
MELYMGSFFFKIRSLLCLLTRNSAQATKKFNNLLLEKIKAAFQSHYMTSFDFGFIHHEMVQLFAKFDIEDSCWEQWWLCCVMKLLLLSFQNKSPAVLEAITLPCLHILYGLIIKSKATGNERKNADPEAADQAASVLAALSLFSSFTTSPNITFDRLTENVTVDMGQWPSCDSNASFAT